MSFTGTVNSQFAGGGAVSHDNRMDPILYEDMIQYIEVNSPFRDMCRVVTTDQFVMILPRKSMKKHPPLPRISRGFPEWTPIWTQSTRE